MHMDYFYRRSSMHISRLLLVCALLGGAQSATASSPGSRLYAPCMVCHQASAWGSADGAIPSLAGQQRRYLEKQIAVFRSGARVDPAMQTVTAHPTMSDPKNIAILASYLSKLAPNPNPVQGAGAHLLAAADTYGHICAACHGIDGSGDAGNRVPRIAGQHYPYLRKQIEAAAELHKNLAPPEMTSALRGMRPEDRDVLADYISHLGVLGSSRNLGGPAGMGR
ncbi:MAG: c-type cytochrome [Steroidobacteraceae bacterium]|jgi:cytochrome c553